MYNTNEIIKVCKVLGIGCNLLSEVESYNFISQVLDKFKPFKITGHLAIGHDSISIPLENNEFTYSTNLNSEIAYIFFDQEGIDRKKVVVVENAQEICRIMEKSFGIEYFMSNNSIDYLIAVNWYVVEVSGSAKNQLASLI